MSLRFLSDYSWEVRSPSQLPHRNRKWTSFKNLFKSFSPRKCKEVASSSQGCKNQLRHVLSLMMIKLFVVIRLWKTRPDRSKFTNKIQTLELQGFSSLFTQLFHSLMSGRNSGFFLWGGATLRNGAGDWWGKQILKANMQMKASS